jgi:hypothetical protein
VQLKLYPAIFVFALIEDWSDWKNSIKRFIGLGLVNTTALFIFGAGNILSTFGAQGSMESSHIGRPFNLSISSLVLHILSLDSLPHKRIVLWLQANSLVPELFLAVFFVVCFLIILWQAHKRGSKGFNPYVFMACTIGILIIPSISFDYKLAVLPASVVLLIPAILALDGSGNNLLLNLFMFLFSMAYSSTLYPFMYKPHWLQFNQPALLLILTICTIFSCLRWGEAAKPLSPAPEVNPEGQ